jgi:hypothetical protein
MRILTCIYMYIYLYFTQILYSKGVFMCIAIVPALLDGSNVRLNWNIESDMNVHWIKFKNFLSLY